MLNASPDESLMPLPESPDILLDAWREALGDALARERATWQRERALIEAQAAQSIAELHTRVIELERKLENLMQQKLFDVMTMVQDRLAQVRDGAPGRNGESIVGPVGERGEIGLQGPPGPQGPQGERGYGSEGKVGPQGPQGAKGDSVKGERGEAGPQGFQGPQGQKGADGRDGLSIIGPEGPSGARGVPGERGERGEPGRRGEPGERGVQGSQGEPGPKGDPGESIVGPAGIRGLPGPDGARGERGERGERGIDGIPGKLPRVKAWQPDIVFYDGNVVCHERATYQALKDTSQRPGASEDWICIAAGGLDAETPQVRGTYDSAMKYRGLDIVVSNGGSFIARHDNPGSCPGEGWQMIARQGQRGVAGEKGERGERGAQGEPGKAVTLKGWIIDRQNFVAIPLMSDGSRGAMLELRGLFEQFQNDIG
jgi:hypothetical protein